jgi:hypothetical protein
VLVNACSAIGAVVALVIGGRAWGAILGLLVVTTVPLLAVAPAMAWWKGLGLRRSLHRRPQGFG